ncbi:MAG: glycosyltransferase family 39 protein [Actinomycetota bacterium]|nr:glycosyltransferase family 39 protein [Actinomycetota bacterium]MCL6094119.1 glycosyltransferase family 39 protein [Actinomycetota bacterium]MDA8166743.1 glycosyltransferase family 39 protein [Actinomycetota bacterium]
MTDLPAKLYSRAARLKPGHYLTLIFVAGLLVRIVAVMHHPAVQGDEIVYLSDAENLSKGLGLESLGRTPDTVYFPLLPLLIASLHVLLRNFVIAGEATVVIFGMLTMLAIYLLARKFTGAPTALRAAALGAVFPLLVYYSSLIYTETVYTFFLLMAILFAWDMLHGFRLRDGLLAGASLGLAYLTNPAAVYYLAIFAILATALVVLRKRGWRPVASAVAVMAAVFLVFAAPYVYFLHNHLDRWTYSGKTATANINATTNNLTLVTPDWEKQAYALTADGHGVQVAQDLYQITDPVSFVAMHPGLGFNLLKTNARHFLRGELVKTMPLWLLPLLLLGIFTRMGYRDWMKKLGFLMLMILPVLMIFILDYRSRFFVPFTALSLIFLALGWTRIDEWLRKRLEGGSSQRLILAQLAVAVLILLPALGLAGEMVRREGNPGQFRLAGSWLEQHEGAGLRVMDRNYIGAYYADGISVVLPYADYSRTTAYARYNRVDYMIVSKDDIVNWRPGLSILLAGDSGHPDWRLVDTIYPDTSREVMIYQLMPA